MARTVALSAFRTLLRERYDGENQTARHTDAQLTGLANAGYRVLRSVVTEYGYAEFLSAATGAFTGNPATGETYAEIAYPSGAVSVRGVDVYQSPQWQPLDPIAFQSRRQYAHRAALPEAFTVLNAGTVSGTTYTAGTIAVMPVPAAGAQYKVWYLPEWADLSTDTHLFLYQDENWLQYHLYWCMAELCMRDRDDPSREQRCLFELNPGNPGSIAHRIRAHAPRVVSAGPKAAFTRSEQYGWL